MGLPLRKVELNRTSAFSFSCRRCLSCCHFKKIQLNPYEVARLAANRGISTTAFLDQYTIAGSVLRFTDEGSCIFLDANGCSVHADRPLVCRLYPLGRYVDYYGVETFSQIELEDGCRGELGEAGPIAHYLEEQGALPFMAAADRYLGLLWFLMDQLQEQETGLPEREILLNAVQSAADGALYGPAATMIDLDLAVERYCDQSGMPVPHSIEERMLLHIKAVRDWAA